MKHNKNRMHWRLAIVCFFVLGTWQWVGGQVTNPPEPSIPAVPPPSLPQPGLPEGGVGAIVGRAKLDQVLQTALEQIAEQTLNTFELLNGLGLEADTRLRVLVEVQFSGNADPLEARIAELNGLVLMNSQGLLSLIHI